MLQTRMISKVRETALADEAVSAVLIYGSFIKGEGDRYSDIEFYVFMYDSRNADRHGRVSRISPTALFFTNEFGTDVAIFENMIRGEFHFLDAKDIGIVRSWQGLTSFEYRDRMNLVDKDGALASVLGSIEPPLAPVRDTAENVRWLAESLLNNLILVRNLLRRGEFAHAHRTFWYVHKYLLWLIRISVSSTAHWESPAKAMEKDIPAAWYGKYAACVPRLEADELKRCFMNAMSLSRNLFDELGVPADVCRVLGRIGSVAR